MNGTTYRISICRSYTNDWNELNSYIWKTYLYCWIYPDFKFEFTDQNISYTRDVR